MKPSQYSTEIGRRIREAREGKDLSLEGLAKLTNRLLSKSRIGNYEQGTRMLGPEEANILGSILDVEPAYLMCLQLDFSKHQLDFVRNWMCLPENMREEYFTRIEALSLAYRKPVSDEKLTGWKAPAPQQSTTPQARRTKLRHPVKPK